MLQRSDGQLSEFVRLTGPAHAETLKEIAKVAHGRRLTDAKMEQEVDDCTYQSNDTLHEPDNVNLENLPTANSNERLCNTDTNYGISASGTGDETLAVFGSDVRDITQSGFDNPSFTTL